MTHSLNRTEAHVGILCMAAGDPVDLPGGVQHSGSLPLPPDLEVVPDADGASSPAAYRVAARTVVERGAAFVTTDCAWNIELADDIKAGCGDVPSLPSVLSLLPLLTDVFPVVGIVSIRAWRLREVMAATKVAPYLETVRIEGVSEDGPWRTVDTESQVGPDALEDELVRCGSRLVQRERAAALLLDCTTFAPFASAIQQRCGVPAFGLTGLMHYLMGSGTR